MDLGVEFQSWLNGDAKLKDTASGDTLEYDGDAWATADKSEMAEIHSLVEEASL